MTQLTNSEKVRVYLKKKNLFVNQETDVNFVDIGNINYVYRIKTLNDIFYLKYYGECPRRNTLAIEKLGDMVDRFGKESGAIRFMKTALDKSVSGYIPDIVYSDDVGKVIIMTDIAFGGCVLKELLLSDFNVDDMNYILEQLVSKMIAEQHGKTFRKNTFRDYFYDDIEFNKRFYDFRTTISCEKLSKKQYLKVREKADLLYEKNLEFPCLINADFSPKQIFVWPDFQGIGLCDFEFMGGGIASYDVGFFLANMQIIRDVRNDYQQELDCCMKNFIESYFVNLEKEVDDKEFLRFTKEHLYFYVGTGILNRVDAVPLESHIPISKISQLRKTAVDFIFNDKEI